MGILLPLAGATYGICYISHPRMQGRFGRAMDPNAVMGIGIMALGMAVVVHAFGFGPYARVPWLKYVVAAAGVALFLYGLAWQHRG